MKKNSEVPVFNLPNEILRSDWVWILLMVIFIFAMICLSNFKIATMARTAKINQVGEEITHVFRNQMDLYALKVLKYLRTKSDEDKAAAMGCWFSKAELDAKSTYTYEEIKEKFKNIVFDSFDRDLTELSQFKRLDISIKNQVYENDLLIAYKTLVEIETEDGTFLFPITENFLEEIHKCGENELMQ